MPQEKAGINLLPTSQVEQTRINPYVKWFVSNGFYVYVIAYAVVLGVLGTQWFFDNQLNSLNASITDKAEQITDAQDFVLEYQDLQEQYVLTSALLSKYDVKFNYLDLVEQTIPEPITLIRLTAAGKQITIEGTTPEYLAINQWQYDLGQLDTVKKASVTQIERTPIADSVDDRSEQVQFTMLVEVK